MTKSPQRETRIDDTAIWKLPQQRIEPHKLWPFPSGNLSPFSGELSSNHYLKEPNFVNFPNFEEHEETFADLLLHEASIFENYLWRHPHPNIAKYFGYVKRDDGRIRGLCLERYQRTLYEFLHSEEYTGDASWMGCSEPNSDHIEI